MTAKRQSCSPTAQPASQAATGERSRRAALLSLAPPLVASRDVTTPTSTPLGRNPAPLSSQLAWLLPGCQHKHRLPSDQWSLGHTLLRPVAPRLPGFCKAGSFAARRETRLLLIPQDPSVRPPLPFSPAITWNSDVPNPEVRACMQLRRNGESDRAGSRKEKKGRIEGVQGFQESGSQSQGTWRSTFFVL